MKLNLSSTGGVFTNTKLKGGAWYSGFDAVVTKVSEKYNTQKTTIYIFTAVWLWDRGPVTVNLLKIVISAYFYV